MGVLRALGASPAMTMADGLLGILGAVVLGSVLALLVAVALSPLAPIGPARTLDPGPGLPSTGPCSVLACWSWSWASVRYR